MRQNKITKLYIKNVKRQIKTSSQKKKQLLYDLKINTNNYISEYPNSTYSDLEAEFGTPVAIAESFYDSLDTAEIKHQQTYKKHIILIIIIFCTICALSFIWHYHKLNQNLPAYTIEEIDEIEEIQEIEETTETD